VASAAVVVDVAATAVIAVDSVAAASSAGDV
jgi:hypothetical protein